MANMLMEDCVKVDRQDVEGCNNEDIMEADETNDIFWSFQRF